MATATAAVMDADREDAELWTDIQTMLARSPTAAQTGEAAEDWGIFDHEHFGGLRIDERTRVLRDDDTPVDGLYAAGVDAGGVATGGYASGLAQALVQGLAAAEEIAR